MMQDPRTGIFNFDPEGLYRIPQPAEFAFDRIAPYSKPSTHKVNKTAWFQYMD